MEQIAACGAKLLCRVARVGPFVFARVVFENVRVSRSVLEDATDKISWLGGWQYCQEFVCYVAVQCLLLTTGLFG